MHDFVAHSSRWKLVLMLLGAVMFVVVGLWMIVLKLRDLSRYPGKGMVAMLAKANRVMTGGDVHISMTGTNRSFDEAMAAVRYFRH